MSIHMENWLSKAMIRERQSEALLPWLEDAGKSGTSALTGFAKGIKQDLAAVTNWFNRLIRYVIVILSEAKNLSCNCNYLKEILRFAQNDMSKFIRAFAEIT